MLPPGAMLPPRDFRYFAMPLPAVMQPLVDMRGECRYARDVMMLSVDAACRAG